MTSPLGRVVLGVTGQAIVRRAITETRPGRALAHRFVAGDTIDDAVAVTRRINGTGASVSLDHLGEHVSDRTLAEQARDDYLECLDRIASEGLDANISVKLTQLGMGLDVELAEASLLALAARAADLGTTVTVDMEESVHVAATLAMYEAAQTRHGNLGIALQAYLFRTRADLERVIPLGGHVRLCKGAYREPRDIAFRERRRVSASFDVLARRLMAAAEVKPAIATHDLDRIALARELGGVREGPYEFQMLYGVREPLQQELLAAGEPLRIYLPYGAAWYPYLTRRIAERPANLWFFLRALLGART